MTGHGVGVDDGVGVAVEVGVGVGEHVGIGNIVGVGAGVVATSGDAETFAAGVGMIAHGDSLGGSVESSADS